MENLFDVPLFHEIDVDLFPVTADITTDTISDAWESLQKPMPSELPPAEEVAVKVAELPKQPRKSTSATKKHTPTTEKPVTPNRTTKNPRNVKADWMFWILEAVLVLCNAWIIAAILFVFRKKSTSAKGKSESFLRG